MTDEMRAKQAEWAEADAAFAKLVENARARFEAQKAARAEWEARRARRAERIHRILTLGLGRAA